MAKYTVVSSLCHDGKDYAEGDEVELSNKKVADDLLAAGVVEPIEVTKAKAAEAAKAAAEAAKAAKAAKAEAPPEA